MIRKAAVVFAIVASIGASILVAIGHFAPTTEAQRGVSARFEYAAINGSYPPYPADGPSSVSSAVNICYLQVAGCQNEEVRAEINISKFLQDERLENAGNARTLAGTRAMNAAYSRAISKLGAEGWEIVEAPGIEFDLYYTNPQGIQTVKMGQQTERKHVWFKRVRQ
jgi:hypothetical protein